MCNLTPLRVGLIQIVDKEEMHTVISLVDEGTYFAAYIVFLVKTGFLWGLDTTVGVSFANRAQSICAWMAGKI
jgi:hypothetical protein